MSEESKSGKKQRKNFGLMQAMSWVQGTSDATQEKKLRGFQITSVANLVTALLRELSQTYVTADTERDCKMRNQIIGKRGVIIPMLLSLI